MLLHIDYKDKTKSVYKCDKCNKTSDIHRLKLDNHTYHLCDRCYLVLEYWLKKRS